MSQGKYNEAYSLLSNYCQTRLLQYREAEKSFNDAFKSGAAVGPRRAEKKNARATRSMTAINGRTNKNRIKSSMNSSATHSRRSLVARNREELRRQSRSSGGADFGVVQLHRAQAIADPRLRKAELQLAEETFLAIGNAVGDSDEFKLNMAKVNYWLGKHDEGKKLLDDILQRNANDFRVKYAVANAARGRRRSRIARAAREAL